jgi:hypothetical protein
MWNVILGAIVGLTLGALLGRGTQYLCEEGPRGDVRKFSRLPVYRNNNAAELTEAIDIAPVFPMVGASLGSIVGAVAGATAAVVRASRCQPKATAP